MFITILTIFIFLKLKATYFRQTHQTPSQFIHQVRLERANELLREGKLNVTQVAYEVGYSSQSYFSKMYQEYYGYSPKKDKV